ncbi:MAG: membrane dipeptidase [Anaerolineae bacterium]|jgi:membrane dipeptidase|nr:membrane dipeptidase [Anaerolineae bacterium]
MTDIIVDAHLDLSYNAVALGRDLRLPLEELRALEQVTPPPGKWSGAVMATFPELRRGRVAVVGGSIFVEPAHASWSAPGAAYHNAEEAHAQALAQLETYLRWADAGELQFLRNCADLEACLASWDTASPVIGLFLVMEGAAPIREPAELGWWVEQGLRGVGLSWAAGTPYAGGNANPGPLTGDGRALLHEMAAFNLLLDISHLWETAAYEALDLYPGPVAASHANPRALRDGARQLPDELIRQLAARDGVVGIIPFNWMLDAEWTATDARLPLNRVIEAVDHICQVTGSPLHVGLGTDCDGGMGMEKATLGLDSVANFGKLAPLLQERGYAAEDIVAILGGNWLRLLRATLSNF